MKEKHSVLSRLLIPVKDIEFFERILPLVELLSHSVGDTFEKLDLLHVVGGSFLSTHLGNIDFRVGHVISSDLMKRLRGQHYEEIVNPMLEHVKELLKKKNIELEATFTVENGDPVKKISAICEKENYSSLIMCRQPGSEEGIFTGSVLTGVLHRHFQATVYIVGENGFESHTSPVARVVVGIDGSPSSIRAAREAAFLLGRSGEAVEKVSLVHVMDQACLVDEESISCQEASEAGERYLQEAKDIMVEKGVREESITLDLLFGKPAEAISIHAHSLKATMLYIGRRERSNLSQVLLGSVCGDLVQRCKNKTVVLACHS